ncbi:sigma-54 interaction domain-containing protein [Alkalibaculum sporogenes]|nr:sigma 54-interacting transcriptional regulator [Alkalibaculum sporogenes]
MISNVNLNEAQNIINQDCFTNESILLKILSNIPEAIIVIDINTKICFINDAYCRLFKKDKQEIIGRLLSKFEPLARIHDVLKNGEPMVGDISHIHSANIDVVADIMPLFYNGTLIGAVANMKNVTDIIHMQIELDHFKSLTQFLKEELYNNNSDNLPDSFKHLARQNKTFVNILKIASKVASTDASVFIDGESGVGKEVMAQAIHSSSKRSSGPFIKINCSAIPESLIESELFGYQSGAFTGANSNGRIGRFESANGGTVFLDEIGEMSLSMQVKFLRVLQEKEIERVGSNKKIKLDFRLISATNRNLEKMIEDGTFRLDLFYRINVVPLRIPPLRDRKEDIPYYANLFLEEMCATYNKELTFSPEVLRIFSNYEWPGNIRELKNIVEQLAILCSEDIITSEFLSSKFDKQIGSQYIGNSSNLPLNKLIEKVEREAIISALQCTNNNKTHAIEMLGISRRGFYQKLEKYNIKT